MSATELPWGSVSRAHALQGHPAACRPSPGSPRNHASAGFHGDTGAVRKAAPSRQMLTLGNPRYHASAGFHGDTGAVRNVAPSRQMLTLTAWRPLPGVSTSATLARAAPLHSGPLPPAGASYVSSRGWRSRVDTSSSPAHARPPNEGFNAETGVLQARVHELVGATSSELIRTHVEEQAKQPCRAMECKIRISTKRMRVLHTSNALALQVGDDSLDFRGRPAGEGGRKRGHVAHALRWNAQVLQQLQLRPSLMRSARCRP